MFELTGHVRMGIHSLNDLHENTSLRIPLVLLENLGLVTGLFGIFITVLINHNYLGFVLPGWPRCTNPRVRRSPP